MNKNRRRGLALIFTVAILLVLSIMAVSFARIAAIEFAASKNFSGKVEARLVAMAGIDRAVASLGDLFSAQGYTAGNQEWSYPHAPDFSLESAILQAGAGRSVSYESAISPTYNMHHSGILAGGTYDPVARIYSLKIIDMSGQINVNSHIGIPGTTSVPAHQVMCNRTIHRLLRSLALACGFNSANAEQVASALVDVDNFTPVVDPNAVVLPRRWEYKDAVISTVQNLGLDTARTERFLNNVTVSSWLNRSTAIVGNPGLSAVAIPNYLREARAPVNINTASREVLAALLMGVTARPVYLDNSPSTSGAAKFSASQDGNVEIREDRDLNSLPVRNLEVNLFADNDPAGALAFADLIIAARDNPVSGPFKSWGDFDSFIQGSSINGFIPNNAAFANAFNPGEGGIEGTQVVKQNLGTQTWAQICRDLLKANFNSNTLDNRFNPTRPSRLRVSKGDLFNNGNQHTHTTEFTFSSLGYVEITSLGQLIDKVVQQSVRSAMMRAEVSLLQVYHHTTQQHFETALTLNANNYPNFHGATTTYPAVVEKNLTAPSPAPPGTPLFPPDDFAGRVEPHINIMRTLGDAPIYSSPFQSGRGSTPSIPASDSRRFTTAFATPADWQMRIGTGLRNNDNNLANDGLLSELSEPRFFSISATTDVERSVNLPSGSNLPYYRGGIEFWVKLGEDSNAQVPSGLFGSTQVDLVPPYQTRTDPILQMVQQQINDLSVANGQPQIVSLDESEGVQFFIFKNLFGQLRISRLHFCLCYDEAGTGYLGTHLNVDADNSMSPFTFPFPRRDVVVQNLNWLPNTWHHIYVEWDDTANGNDLRIRVDGDQQTGAEIAEQVVAETPAPNDQEFVLLNERAPKDGMHMNGFFRLQAGTNSDGGMFKVDPGSTPGVTPPILFPGNSTMANLHIYNNNGGGPISPAPPAQPPSIFPSSADYTQLMHIPVSGRLGTISWTSYPRRTGNPNLHVTLSGRVLDSAGAQLATFVTPATIPPDGYDGEGVALGVQVEANSYVEYTANLQSTNQQCSALDDVTVTLFKPTYLLLTEVW